MVKNEDINKILDILEETYPLGRMCPRPQRRISTSDFSGAFGSDYR